LPVSAIFNDFYLNESTLSLQGRPKYSVPAAPGEVIPGELTPGEVTPGEVAPGEVTPETHYGFV
jgi:hypothetical protein